MATGNSGDDAGYSIDISKAATVFDALSIVGDSMSYWYGYFGRNTDIFGPAPISTSGYGDPTGLASTAPQAPTETIGSIDADGDAPSPDMPDAWHNFCSAWGEYMDAAIGTVYAEAAKMKDTADAYQRSDGAAAAVLKPYVSGAKIANLTTLAAPTSTSDQKGEESRWAWLTKKVPPPA